MARSREPWLLALLVIVAADMTGASSLSDFSNNLATDLGPLVQLLGEPVTKQYLSEATTFVDYFIFAMAPIGILTAVVSVIRVCGDSALRAFIGRAQESETVVEAELCTSTSRDVCELFNKGGVTRVLGRPKILEIVHVSEDSTSTTESDSAGEKGHVGDGGSLLHFRDYLQDKSLQKEKDWKEREPRKNPLLLWKRWKRLRGVLADEEGAGDEDQKSPALAPAQTPFAPNPNLSLNVGIVKLPSIVFYLVALVGFVIQAGLLVMAAVTAWHPGILWRPDDEDPSSSLDPSPDEVEEASKSVITRVPAPMIFILGSVFMCLGMFLCAALVGHSTRESIFLRKSLRKPPRTRLYWLQPGNQVIGDQTFDAFAFAEEDDKMLKEYISSRKDLSKRAAIYTWIAISLTLGGYVAQFVGLRGMNSYVSVTQLAGSLAMSFLRGCLRMRRISRTDNRLATMPDKVLRHELDWMAFEISRHGNEDIGGLTASHEYSWCPHGKPLDPAGGPGSEHPAGLSPIPATLLGYRVQLAVLTGNRGRQTPGSQSKDPHTWSSEQILVRETARRLQTAIEGAVEVLLRDCHVSAELRSITIPIPVILDGTDHGHSRLRGRADINLLRNPTPTVSDRVIWTAQSSELEAILGIWLWSLKKVDLLEGSDNYGNRVSLAEKILSLRIIGLPDGNYQEEMGMWLGRDFSLPSSGITLDRKDDTTLHTMTLWRMETVGEGADPVLTPWRGPYKGGFGRPIRRLFGWSTFDSTSLPSISEDRIPVCTAVTGQSLLGECAHELFGLCVRHIHSAFTSDLGDVTFSSSSNGKLKWENSKVSSIVSRFEKSGLGNLVDALHLIPTIRKELRPPEGENIVVPLLALSSEYRKKQDWQGAESLLVRLRDDHWRALGRNSPEQMASHAGSRHLASLCGVLIALGELYRWAIGRHERDRRDFGHRGISSMGTYSHGKPLEADNSPVEIILKRYSEVSQAVARWNGQPNGSEALDTAFLQWQDQFHREKLKVLYDYMESKWEQPLGDRPADATSVATQEGKYSPESTEDDTEDESHFSKRSSTREIARSDVAAEKWRGQPRPVMDYYVYPLGRFGEGIQVDTWLATLGTETSRIAMLYTLCMMTPQQVSEDLGFSLCRAARYGWVEVVETLIELRAGVSARDKWGRSPLHYASEQGEFAIAKSLLANGADANSIDELGGTPLLLATLAEADDIVALLLKYDTVRTISRGGGTRGSTPLIVSVRTGNVKITKLLLSFGGHQQAEARDNSLRSAIWYASASGYLPICRMLLRSPEWKLSQPDKDGLTAMGVAHWNASEEAFQLLYQRHAETSDPNLMLRDSPRSKRTVLAMAIRRGFLSLFEAMVADDRVDLLSDQLAEVEYAKMADFHLFFCREEPPDCHCRFRDLPGITAKTALGMTIQYDRGEMFDHLTGDAGLPLPGSTTENPLVIAANYGRAHFIKKLHSMVIPEPNRGTPLAMAASNGHVEAVQMLLRDTRIDPCLGLPLLAAVKGGRKGAVDALLADPRMKPGASDITAAFQSKRFGIARRLFLHADNRNMAFDAFDDGTALHVAARYGKPMLIKSILEGEDVSPNLEDANGQTPLSIALSQGSLDAAMALIRDRRTDLDLDTIRIPQDAGGSEPSPFHGTVLHLAISLGGSRGKAAVELLLSSPKLNPNTADQLGRPPLVFLLGRHMPREEKEDLFQLLYNDPSGKVRLTGGGVTTNGRTLLHLVAETGIGLSHMLQCSGTNPNIADAAGQTPLHLAAVSGNHESAVSLLRDSRTDPTIRDLSGRTAFDAVDVDAHSEVASVFISDGRCSHWGTAGTSALHVLAKHWKDDMSDRLLELLKSDGMDPNQCDTDGKTCLSLAIRGGHSELVRLLLANDTVNPSKPDSTTQTCLHQLVSSNPPPSGFLQLLRLLFANKALELNKRNSDGNTPLHVLLANPQRVGPLTESGVKTFIRDERTDLSAQTTLGQTALHLVAYRAARMGMLEHDDEEGRRICRLIKALSTDARMNLNLKDTSGQTAPHIIASNPGLAHALPPLMRALVDHEMLDPNIANADNRTILHLLTSLKSYGQTEAHVCGAITILLQDPRVDVMALDSKKQTALHCAVGVNFQGAVKVLLSDGRVDPNAQDEMGNTATHCAVTLRRRDILEMLLGDNRVNRRVVNGAGETAMAMARRADDHDGGSAYTWLFRNTKPKSEPAGSETVEYGEDGDLRDWSVGSLHSETDDSSSEQGVNGETPQCTGATTNYPHGLHRVNKTL